MIRIFSEHAFDLHNVHTLRTGLVCFSPSVVWTEEERQQTALCAGTQGWHVDDAGGLVLQFSKKNLGTSDPEERRGAQETGPRKRRGKPALKPIGRKLNVSHQDADVKFERGGGKHPGLSWEE